MISFISHSTKETEDFAFDIAKKVKCPQLICLKGDLGAGKTAFTRGFARFFGIEKGVSSPTFTIMHRYDGTETINHYDLYRINDYDELVDIGFEEQIENGISLIEWPDNFEEYFPADRVVINISHIEACEDERLIEVTGL